MDRPAGEGTCRSRGKMRDVVRRMGCFGLLVTWLGYFYGRDNSSLASLVKLFRIPSGVQSHHERQYGRSFQMKMTSSPVNGYVVDNLEAISNQRHVEWTISRYPTRRVLGVEEGKEGQVNFGRPG